MTSPIHSQTTLSSLGNSDAEEVPISRTTSFSQEDALSSLSPMENCCLGTCLYVAFLQKINYFFWEKSLAVYCFFLPISSRLEIYSEIKIPDYFDPASQKKMQTHIAELFLRDLDIAAGTEFTLLENLTVPNALQNTEYFEECERKLCHLQNGAE